MTRPKHWIPPWAEPTPADVATAVRDAAHTAIYDEYDRASVGVSPTAKLKARLARVAAWNAANDACRAAVAETPYGMLRDLKSGDIIRPATEDERDACDIAAEVAGDGKPGIIVLDDETVWVD